MHVRLVGCLGVCLTLHRLDGGVVGRYLQVCLCGLAVVGAPKQQQGEGVALAAAERGAVVEMCVAGVRLLRRSAGVAGPAL